MPDSLSTLQSNIKAAFVQAKSQSDPSQFDATMTQLANAIGTAINGFIAGRLVNVTVSTPSGPGTGTGTIVGG